MRSCIRKVEKGQAHPGTLHRCDVRMKMETGHCGAPEIGPQCVRIAQVFNQTLARHSCDCGLLSGKKVQNKFTSKERHLPAEPDPGTWIHKTVRLFSKKHRARLRGFSVRTGCSWHEWKEMWTCPESTAPNPEELNMWAPECLGSRVFHMSSPEWKKAWLTGTPILPCETLSTEPSLTMPQHQPTDSRLIGGYVWAVQLRRTFPQQRKTNTTCFGINISKSLTRPLPSLSGRLSASSAWAS